jgi:hypothetical protein
MIRKKIWQVEMTVMSLSPLNYTQIGFGGMVCPLPQLHNVKQCFSVVLNAAGWLQGSTLLSTTIHTNSVQLAL